MAIRVHRASPPGWSVLALLIAGVPTPVSAGDSGADRELVRAILALPAPPPDWRARETAWLRGLPPGQRLGEDGVPEDEAPIELTFAYWMEQADPRSRPAGPRLQPSPRVQERLLAAYIDSSGFPVELLEFLPRTSEVCARLIERFGDPLALASSSEWWKTRLGEWILTNDPGSLPLLAKRAESLRDEDWPGSGPRLLEVLMERDFALAEPILQGHADGERPRMRALGKSLLWRHAAATKNPRREEALRRDLLWVVADRGELPSARWIAFTGLMREEWPGREEWYLSLFADPTLREATERQPNGNLLTCAVINDPVARDPVRWVPLVARLVNCGDRTTGVAAVTTLAKCAGGPAGTEACRALLPWIADPLWAGPGLRAERLAFLESLDRVPLPEAVPALLGVLARADWSEMAAAGRGRAATRDARAIPALRASLETPWAKCDAEEIVLALAACGGLSDEEGAHGVLGSIRVPGGREEDLRSPPTLIGEVLRRPGRATEGVATVLARLAAELPEAEQDIQWRVDALLASWPHPSAIRHVVNRLAGGKLDVRAIVALCANAAAAREHAAETLTRLAATGRPAAGIAAALAGTPAAIRGVLEGGDPVATAALAAAARLTALDLPFEAVTRMLGSEDALLRDAAEAWLTAADTPEARRILWARHPGEALLLGRRGGYTHLERDLASLRAEVLAPGGPDEILALVFGGAFARWGSVVVRVRGQEVEVSARKSNQPESRRPLDRRELTALREWLQSNGTGDLAALETGAHDGVQCEFLRIARSGGYHVYMNNPGLGRGLDVRYLRLVRRFLELGGLDSR
jgi:hypothetical protein